MGVRMNNYRKIEEKLRRFIRKYYKNKLLKGLILFTAAGLLYFIAIVSLEYFLWLGRTGRSILFWVFIIVELFLFSFYIIYPFSQLLKFAKGISKEEASAIIGRHFPQVNDKLLNLLQLKKHNNSSELLMASIDQKSAELQPIPFSAAVNFRSSVKYLKFAFFPILIILLLIFTGNSSVFKDGYTRVVHYKQTYEPPAPFSFQIENKDLNARENEDFKLRVNTNGKLLPERVSIHFNGQTYFLKSIEPGRFEYDFNNLSNSVDFYLSANEVKSAGYRINIIKVPKLLDFEMYAHYPSYTGMKDETVKGTGNLKVPEGTNISWKFMTRDTRKLKIVSSDSIIVLNPNENLFAFKKQVFKDFHYAVSTANDNILNYEELDYEINVIKDEYPEIHIEQRRDSVDNTIQYFKGKISDDYGIKRLDLVYYKEGRSDSLKTVNIPASPGSFYEFLYSFPGNLKLEKGENYEFYFRVFDNDGVNGSKSAKSSVFSYREKSLKEIEKENLENQQQTIGQLHESLENLKDAEKELNDISRTQKEKDNLSYNERKQLENFIERQKKQMELMKNYSDKLKQSLKDDVELTKEDNSKNLKERLERTEERLEKNEELLKELQELSEKISREDLVEKLEQLSKNNHSETRNLEQLLELTKKYYVEEKKQKLARDLEQLGKKQEQLSEKAQENNSENQQKLGEEFKEFKKQMDELEKDNQEMKNPEDLGRDEKQENEIVKDQKEAEEMLNNSQNKDASQKQKSAGKKMRTMAQKMKQQSSMQNMQQLDADISSLRQILDNLVIFSFEQEDLMKNFRNLRDDNPVFAEKLKRQNVLREHFSHIDDSLYSLALKNPLINEKITENLTNIEFDIGKSLERLSENQLPQALASQQYVITGANNLAYLLSNILSSLQQMMNPQMGQGSGKGEFQLPDIIQQQEQLEQQMQQEMEMKEHGEKGGNSEEENGRIMEMYQKQEQIKNQLEQLMKKEGEGNSYKQLERNIEKIEKELLDKGVNKSSLENIKNLKHQLLKLENARLQQGEDNKRESKTSREDFGNPVNNQNIKAKEYFNSTEILNRQMLPLRPNYKTKVRTYFEGRGY